MSKTMILKPLESVANINTEELIALNIKIKEYLDTLKLADDVSDSFKDMLFKLGTTEEQYILAIRAGLTSDKIFLKRSPSEDRINCYNKVLLQTWKANMDIQYVLFCFKISSQMETIAVLAQATQSYGPYPKAIRVLVVETKQQQDVLVVGLADKSGIIKAICYERSLASKFQKNKTLLIRNFQKGRSCVIINKNTQIAPATPLTDIQETILHQAKCLVNPTPPELVELKDITAPSPGTQAPLVTVCGEVVQDEAPHSVGQAAQEVRNILIKDKSTTMPLALWNKATKSPVKTGDRIHVPPPSTKKGTIIALEEADDNLLLTVLTNDGDLTMCTLPTALRTLLLRGTVEETLQHISDRQYIFSLRGSTIEKLAPAFSSPSTSTNGTTSKPSTENKN
ncbi:hypothetical protein HOLleu_03359 [Holothuria leucospilota]|uniref:Uncharacterized protein n=1 Tax=Holothuria leucospilota TaxID=206669 RepID=A0A9Q1HLS9_HOLLE|nr:hypothetical protein HOLleu_03359 [Holothuria leucospilota]